MLQKTKITDDFLTDLRGVLTTVSADKICILTDSETNKLCLPLLLHLSELRQADILSIPAGDEHKNVKSLVSIWEYLSKNGATRKSLMVNLGGGMITDLGGFAASTFKRGIRYLNIPTTLLASVDAATGGKTGINFCGLKNEIGVINPAEQVLINVDFFRTLSRENLLSGYAEMLKHAFISSVEVWKRVLTLNLDRIDFQKLGQLLAESLAVKEEIVKKDPQEQNIRKALNFGHTIGHAFESLSYEQHRPVLHGYAVAWGMLCELYLSHFKLGFPKEVFVQYRQVLKEFYGFYTINCKDYERLYELMKHDKKNDSSHINFTLLTDIGAIHINQVATKEEIFEALDFYREVAP